MIKVIVKALEADMQNIGISLGSLFGGEGGGGAYTHLIPVLTYNFELLQWKIVFKSSFRFRSSGKMKLELNTHMT